MRALVMAGLLLVLGCGSGDSTQMIVYKSPTCGCCTKWIEHMQRDGFAVEAKDVRDLAPVKSKNGVPASLEACHTATVGGYVVEGHVPAADIKRLLAERPHVTGIAVAGMPEGSPGMEGPNPESYEVMAFDGQGGSYVFARHEAR